MSVRVLLAACAACVVAAPVGAGVVEPVSEVRSPTASSPIVYQGQLSYLDIPVTTTADLRFRLYDDAGDQLGDEISVEGVDLIEGAFEAVLDFGLANAGWLEVDVRSPSGEGEYVTLSPRQRISTLPPVFGDGASLDTDSGSALNEAGGRGVIALRPGAGQGGGDGLGDGVAAGTGQGERPGQGVDAGGGSRGAGWLMAGSTVFYNGGNVGIGTNAPDARLHVTGAGALTAHIENTQVAGGNFGLQVEAGGATSRAIFARANRTVGQNYGVFGQSLSSRGTGVFGQAQSPFGVTYGVTGVSRAASGTGVRGLATAAGGTNYGVYGEVNSPRAFPGFFVGGEGIHVKKDDLNVSLSDTFGGLTNNDFGGVLVEAINGAVEIFSRDENGFGSSVTLKEVMPNGTFVDSWVIARDSSGSLSDFGIGYSTSATAFSNDDFTISTAGNVGVGRKATTNDLEVNGTASKSAAGDWLANSDARIKQSVETVTKALDTIGRVRLVSFEYTDAYRASHSGVGDGRYLNVIAQEFARVFPEHVKGSGEYLADGSEILQVDTYPLTIYSAAAVQELRGVVQKQERRIEDLEERLLLLETLVLEGTP